MCVRRSALNEDETWYHAVLRTLPDAALLVEGGRCIGENAAAERLFGVAGREEFLGQDISRFLSPEQPDESEPGESIDTCILGVIHDGPRKCTWQCRRADGTVFDAEVILVPVRTDDSDATLILARDACRGERPPDGGQTADLRERKATLRNPVPIVIWSPEMNILAVDKAFLQMTGYEREAVESMSVRDFESLDRTVRSVADAVRSRERIDEEVTLDLPSGPRTLIRSILPLVGGDGNVVEVLTIYRDPAP